MRRGDGNDVVVGGFGGGRGGSGPSLIVAPVGAGSADKQQQQQQTPRTSAATGASAAGVRAFTSQLVAFYFRAPVKAFFRTRVDYLAYARAGVHHQMTTRTEQLLAQAALAAEQKAQVVDAARANPAWLRHVRTWLRGTTPGVVASAVRLHGWRVVPDQVLPPLLANVAVGAILYTSYLQILGHLHPESGKATKRVYPPPEMSQTFTAGLLAGSIQSLAAAPLDAIQARYDHREVMSSTTATTTATTATGSAPRGPAAGSGVTTSGARPPSMWAFGATKLREIGLRGCFAGWGLSLVKDSVGCAVFFSTFEYVKAQSYYGFVRWYYGDLAEDVVGVLARRRPAHVHEPGEGLHVIRPHYSIEPMFLLGAGVTASVAQQLLLHPLTKIQVEHWNHLEDLDEKARRYRAAAAAAQRESWLSRLRWRMFRAYYHAYQETWTQCKAAAKAEGRSTMGWLYRGVWWNTVRQVPSTSAGLIIFELVRRKYGFSGEEVRITKDGYDILLS